MSVIRTTKLTKTFQSVRAISDVDIDITPGAITGFLGPNGAGKSTTMNILMGFIAASSGEAWLFDEKVSVGNAAARRDVGFLSNSTALDKSLTAAQEIEYFGHLAGGYDKKYVAELTKRLGLDATQKIGKLSTGNYQKVGLVIALMHKPKLLVLDDPTNGLDPLVQAECIQVFAMGGPSEGDDAAESAYYGMRNAMVMAAQEVGISLAEVAAKQSLGRAPQEASSVLVPQGLVWRVLDKPLAAHE